MGMAMWSAVTLFLALAALDQLATARNVPNEDNQDRLNDQKTFGPFAGLGGFTALGSNWLPVGGLGGVPGAGIGDQGGDNGVGGLSGAGGLGPFSGGGLGGLGGVGGGNNNGGGLVGGGFGGAGTGGGGDLPNP